MVSRSGRLSSRAIRIESLAIETLNLARATAYYRDVTGFSLVAADTGTATFALGRSQFIWRQAPQPLPTVYHIAFGIPPNSIDVADAWLSTRAERLKDAQGQSLLLFSTWQTQSILLERCGWQHPRTDFYLGCDTVWTQRQF